MEKQKRIMRSKWNEEKISAAAKQFKTATEFARGHTAAYKAAQKLGILQKVCAHMERKSKRPGFWTEATILKEALKYKTRTAFIKGAPGAYKWANELGILAKAYAHMERVGSKYKRGIYAFEFPDKSVYVGLTFNFETRYKEHLSHNRIVKKKSDLLGHRFVKFPGWFHKEIAALKEHEAVERYRKRGWTILNKAKPGGLGKDKFWTKKLVLAEAAKYETIYEFRTQSPKAYGAANRLRITALIAKTLRSRIKRWTRKSVLEEARKYKSRTEFRNSSPSAAQAARRFGIYELACKHMEKKQNPVGYWTENRIVSTAKNYRSLTDFLENERAALSAARRLGIYKKLVSKMRRTRAANGFWTQKRVAREALKFKHRTEFMKGSPNAYGAAHRLGILDSVCSHMLKKQSDFGKSIAVNGRKFHSIAAAAKVFSIDGHQVASRIRQGWSPEEALGLKKRTRPTPGIAIRFRGKKYRSRSELARAYNIDVSTVEARLNNGWSLEEALGLRDRENYMGPKQISVEGRTYSSISAAAKAHGIQVGTVQFRLKRKWSIEQAFGLSVSPHLKNARKKISLDNQTFESISALARHYGIKEKLVDSRLHKGWTVKEAVGLVGRIPKKRGKAIVVSGNAYASITDAALALGLNPRNVLQRINSYGWTVEEAFEVAPSPKNRKANSKARS